MASGRVKYLIFNNSGSFSTESSSTPLVMYCDRTNSMNSFSCGLRVLKMRGCEWATRTSLVMGCSAVAMCLSTSKRSLFSASISSCRVARVALPYPAFARRSRKAWRVLGVDRMLRNLYAANWRFFKLRLEPDSFAKIFSPGGIGSIAFPP